MSDVVLPETALPEIHELKIGLHAYSYQLHAVHDPSFDAFALIDRVVRHGLSGVHFSLNGEAFRSVGGTSGVRIREVGAAARDNDLFIEADTCGTEYAHLQSLLHAASQLGADTLRTFSRHTGTVEEQMAKTARDLQRIAPVAADYGITVLLENHEEFTGTEVASVLQAVDHPAIAALFDYGNSMMVGEEPLDAARAMGPYVQSVHFKDHAMVVDAEGAPVVLGTTTGRGSIDLVRVTKELFRHTSLSRFTLENVYGYRAPLHRGANAINTASPTFAIADILDDSVAPGNLSARASQDLAELLDLEDAAVAAGLATVRATLRAVGFERMRNARGSVYMREVVDLRAAPAATDAALAYK